MGKNRIRVDIWFANRKQMACLKTICSHIENMFKGVLYVSVMYSVSVYLGGGGGWCLVVNVTDPWLQDHFASETVFSHGWAWRH